MEPKLTLYTYFRSSAAYRVRIALNMKGLESEQVFIHLRKGEQLGLTYTALNAQRLIPLLVDQDHRFTQSLSIIEYLDEVYPQPPLLPGTPADRAWIRSLALSVACDIHPLNNLRVLKYLSRDMGHDKAATDRWYRHWISLGFSALESTLAADCRIGTFCFGDKPTLADICLVPQLYNAERYDCPLDNYPTILRIATACRALPEFQAAEPSRQADAE